jgi:hypothetical protein
MPASVQRFCADAPDACLRRVSDVRAAQRARGMAPRDDSALTIAFARGEQVEDYPTADVVADELWVTNRVYETTLYGEIASDVMRRVAADLRARHALSWAVTWEIVRFYVPTMLKLYCLEASGATPVATSR